MKGKKREINDWRQAAVGAAKILAGQARTDKEIQKTLRDSISTVFHRRPNNTEIKKLRDMMVDAGAIKKLDKSPVKIGKWTGTADIVSYEIIPEKASGISEDTENPKTDDTQHEPVSEKKKELKFRMSIQRGGMTEGDTWHNAKVLKAFKDFTIVQFELNQETPDDSKMFCESIEELRAKKIEFSFDLKTNPGVIRVVEKLMAL